MLRKPIFTSLAPNAEWDDVWLSMQLMCKPWQWRRGDATATLEAQFRALLPVKHAYAFSSGRAALYAILSTLNLTPEDEVLLQAYTCVAVPDPVLWVEAKPVYVDCEENTFNMSPSDLEKKITNHSKVVIIQHTFGLPANLDALLAIAKKHNLFVIEDCAHALGAEYQGKQVGTFGDAAFFSFGRDKVISSVFGGIAVCADDTIARRLKDLQSTLPHATRFWIIQQLLHLPLIWKTRTFYSIGLGKLILSFSKALHLISKAVYAIEKHGGRPRFVSYRMPNALAILALHQLKKLEQFNMHRRTIAKIYDAKFGFRRNGGRTSEYPNHIYLRYTIRTPHAPRLVQAAKKHNIFLGDWYRTPIAPEGVDYPAIGYTLGSCPTAEKLARESVNLPTDIHITAQDASRILNCIQHFT